MGDGDEVLDLLTSQPSLNVSPGPSERFCLKKKKKKKKKNEVDSSLAKTPKADPLVPHPCADTCMDTLIHTNEKTNKQTYKQTA